jgi:hypothetical protein
MDAGKVEYTTELGEKATGAGLGFTLGSGTEGPPNNNKFCLLLRGSPEKLEDDSLAIPRPKVRGAGFGLTVGSGTVDGTAVPPILLLL